MRNATVERKTSETDIKLSIKIGSLEKSNVNTGIGFFDHMLLSFAKHGKIKLDVECRGDLNVDDHHTVEDIGICLGIAFKKALDDKKGINRYGFASVPMDETLCYTTLDLSGRFFYKYSGPQLNGYIKDFNLQMVNEFFYALAVNSSMNLHHDIRYGNNDHHIVEALFKATGRALCDACRIDPGNENVVMSTKGVI